MEKKSGKYYGLVGFPGSKVAKQIYEEGLDKIFNEAGFKSDNQDVLLVWR